MSTRKGAILLLPSAQCIVFTEGQAPGEASKYSSSKPGGFVLDVNPLAGKYRLLHYFDAAEQDETLKWVQVLREALDGSSLANGSHVVQGNGLSESTPVASEKAKICKVYSPAKTVRTACTHEDGFREEQDASGRIFQYCDTCGYKMTPGGSSRAQCQHEDGFREEIDSSGTLWISCDNCGYRDVASRIATLTNEVECAHADGFREEVDASGWLWMYCDACGFKKLASGSMEDDGLDELGEGELVKDEVVFPRKKPELDANPTSCDSKVNAIRMLQSLQRAEGAHDKVAELGKSASGTTDADKAGDERSSAEPVELRSSVGGFFGSLFG